MNPDPDPADPNQCGSTALIITGTGNAQNIVRDWIRSQQKSWGLTNRKYLAASSARDLPMPVLAPVIHTT
jgi:hypothetical protein